jgi:hypothetical protein
LFAQIKQGVSTWLHKFALGAERALVAEYELRGLTTAEAKADFVQSLLGDADDVSSKTRPFLWKSAYVSGDGSGPITPPIQLEVCYVHTPLLLANHVSCRGYSKGV